MAKEKIKVEEEKKTETKKSYMYIGPKIQKFGLTHGTLKKGEGLPELLKVYVENYIKGIKSGEGSEYVISEKEKKIKLLEKLFVPADKDLAIKIKNCSIPGTRENIYYQNILNLIKEGEL